MKPPPRQKASSTALDGWWPCLLLFVAVAAVYLPSLWNGFVNLDDPLYITQNSHLHEGLTGESFKWAWTSGDVQNWHPLTWLSLLMDRQLFGMGATGFHATNLLLHALNTVLLFILLRDLTGTRWRSLIVAAIFGLHPLRVESVAWISERKDVLSAFFWLLSMIAFARFAKNNVKLFYIVSLAFFVLGLLSKPMVVTLPFALLLLDYWPMCRWSRATISRLVLEKVPYFLLAAASSAITYWVQQRGGAVTSTDILSLSARLANALVSYARYMGKFAWPAGLCAMYTHPGHWPAQTIWEAGALLLVISAFVIWRWRRSPYLGVGWFWFLGTLIPTIGLVQIGRQAMADRYTYIPSIGLALALVWGVAELTEKWRNREKIFRVVVPATIALCAVLTVHQIGYWKNTEVLYQHALEVSPHNWVIAADLGDQFLSHHQNAEAERLYTQAIQLNPYLTPTRCRLAGLMLKQRRFDEALAQFRKAIELEPDDVDAHKGLGATLQEMGRLDEAIDEFNNVIRLRPNDADAFSNLGTCYGMKGRTDDAIAAFTQAAKWDPNSAQVHRDLGSGWANKRRWDEAIREFQRALELDPNDATARQHLESALRDKSRAKQAPVRH